MTEEKIPVPASWLAERDKEDARRKLIDEWRQHLSAQQRKALDEEGSTARFRSHLPLEVLKNLTPDEREALMAHEESEYNRFKPLAVAKSEQLRAHVRAGGSAEDFERIWEAYGRDATIDATVAEHLDRESRASQLY